LPKDQFSDLEAVIRGHANADECLIDDKADFPPIGRVLTFAKIDTNEWHNLFPIFSKRCDWIPTYEG
jgi:hypothetical protein